MNREQEASTIRVVLVDDHPPLRMGLRVILEQQADIRVVGEAGTGAEALALVERLQPDVVVLDCRLPDRDGVAVAREIRQRCPAVRVLALSAYDDALVVRGMIEAGAVGYLLKSEVAQSIVAAVRADERERWFSPTVIRHLLSGVEGTLPAGPTEREAEVLRGLREGQSSKEIASALGISESTVNFHVTNLLGKLGSPNRTAAVVEAIRRGWIEV